MDFKVIVSEVFVSDLEEVVESLRLRAGADVAGRVGSELIDRALAIGRHPLADGP